MFVLFTTTIQCVYLIFTVNCRCALKVLFKEQFWSDFVEAVVVVLVIIRIEIKKIPEGNPFILRVYLCINSSVTDSNPGATEL